MLNNIYGVPDEKETKQSEYVWGFFYSKSNSKINEIHIILKPVYGGIRGVNAQTPLPAPRSQPLRCDL